MRDPLAAQFICIHARWSYYLAGCTGSSRPQGEPEHLSLSTRAALRLLRDERLVVRVVEPDVERPQIGVQTGVLDRDQVCWHP